MTLSALALEADDKHGSLSMSPIVSSLGQQVTNHTCMDACPPPLLGVLALTPGRCRLVLSTMHAHCIMKDEGNVAGGGGGWGKRMGRFPSVRPCARAPATLQVHAVHRCSAV